MTLGERIKVLRTKAKFTQLDIAKKLDMGSSNFGHIENDRVTPSSTVLQKIADLLNTTTDYLLGRTDDPEVTPSMEPKLDDPELNLFFKDFANAPRERQEEMLRFWHFINEQEKSRTKQDKQGE
ncbi:XRE family transcriptional regulator [Paenibacillus albiflavus]|uniref:XRE family transcriptional regulator n=1 Tax=Paenibacillus albiflavus TaxID=2545760 RepID=A0A4V2WMM8_9BACL|nr:helix-turn-helix transcriptional regulator [Paenibacillus albiflavus]TCZ70975.1 XRE family transcriptional regulator [Paenibacillus albiflavus]